jgi:hypothetical protein
VADLSRLSSPDLGYRQVIAPGRLRESIAAELEEAVSAYGTVALTWSMAGLSDAVAWLQ